MISSHGKNYIIKLVERINIATKIVHDKRQVQSVILASRSINSKKIIKTIKIIDIVLRNDYSIFLIEEENIKEIVIDSDETFKKLGRAVSVFHSACSSIEFSRLHWNNFPAHLIKMLKKCNRWSEIKKFLYNNFKDKNHGKVVVCHNDIHAGNIYFSNNNKVIFLDIDDMCKEYYYHDLGMIIANFTNSSYSPSELNGAIEKLLIGYNVETSDKNIKNTLLFAIRKLYFVEAYFLYSNLFLNTRDFEFIKELRKRQAKIKSFLNNYK